MSCLTDNEVAAQVHTALDQWNLANRRVLVLVPDHTRTMRLPLFFRVIADHLHGVAAQLDFLVALGTHPPLDEAAMLQLFGLAADQRHGRYSSVGLLNHEWKNANALATLGTIPAAEIAGLSADLLQMDVPVRINRAVLNYDQIIICGPVFPHEVVGMSGGNKYFFPGIAGPEIIDFTHWLGALITSYTIIGVARTPVRDVIDRAAALIPTPTQALCVVIGHEGIHGVFAGEPVAAHAQAAALAAQKHIVHVPQPYRTVLSVLPAMYDELWVGSKGMYKVEPVVADGGEVIIYAPHITQFSAVHGAVIEEIGFHVRDYFVHQWDRFQHLPWGVIAHSTHVRGAGSYDPATGVEKPRINVTLATGISPAACAAVGLGYRNPADIDPEAWAERNDPDLLVVFRAGEVLYRLAVDS